MVGWRSCGRTRPTSRGATWPSARAVGFALCAWTLWGLGCGEKAAPNSKVEPPAEAAPREPRTARWELRDSLRRDADTARSPADGGGSAIVLGLDGGPPPPAIAGGRGGWRLVYTAGERGVAVGGRVDLQVSPFWGWSTPQVESPTEPGFTRVTGPGAGLECDASTRDAQRLSILIGGRALAAGERIAIEYGVGPAAARVDDFAERRSRFWFAVDGDGDGVQAWIADSPAIEVLAGPAALLSVVAPSVLRPGERGMLRVALLDAASNAGVRDAASLAFDAPTFLTLPSKVEFDARGIAAVEIVASAAGAGRVTARATLADGKILEASSAAIEVSATAPKLRWADLHGHSSISDGSGEPEDYWIYARDVAGLDAAALTDHDHWGIGFVDASPATWAALVRSAREASVPGAFVALPGYEYTDWIHGHRCVLFFGEETPLASALDPLTDTPQKLWDSLRGRKAITIPHHVAGGPIALDWSVEPDAEMEWLIEVSSVHGTSEAADAPRRIYSPVPGHFARDALDTGRRYAFLGSGDSHNGHPGLSHLDGRSPNSGLAAIVTETLDADALLAALRARRVYATSGARIVLRFALAGHPMGSTLEAASVAAGAGLFVHVRGSAAIERVDVIRSGVVQLSIEGDGGSELAAEAGFDTLRAGDYVYVRVVQRDGEMAWSSPVFVR